MIESKDLSVRRQCALLGVARSGVYRPKPVAEADDLAVMRRIDELHLELPFYGSRRMTFELNKEGPGVNRKRVRRLMRVMGIEALVPRPDTSKAAPGHKIYPYLLRGLKIVEPNHVRNPVRPSVGRSWRRAWPSRARAPPRHHPNRSPLARTGSPHCREPASSRHKSGSDAPVPLRQFRNRRILAQRLKRNLRLERRIKLLA